MKGNWTTGWIFGTFSQLCQMDMISLISVDVNHIENGYDQLNFCRC